MNVSKMWKYENCLIQLIIFEILYLIIIILYFVFEISEEGVYNIV